MPATVTVSITSLRPSFTIECDNGWRTQRPNIASMTRVAAMSASEDLERPLRVDFATVADRPRSNGMDPSSPKRHRSARLEV
jgi:hypothetical protein